MKREEERKKMEGKKKYAIEQKPKHSMHNYEFQLVENKKAIS